MYLLYFSPHHFEELLKTKLSLREVGPRSSSHEMSRSEFEPRSVCLLCHYPYNPSDQQHLFETSLRASRAPQHWGASSRLGRSVSALSDRDLCHSKGLRWVEEAKPLATRQNLEGPAETSIQPHSQMQKPGLREGT